MRFKKIKFILLAALTLGFALASIFFYWRQRDTNQQKKSYRAEIEELKLLVDAQNQLAKADSVFVVAGEYQDAELLYKSIADQEDLPVAFREAAKARAAQAKQMHIRMDENRDMVYLEKIITQNLLKIDSLEKANTRLRSGKIDIDSIQNLVNGLNKQLEIKNAELLSKGAIQVLSFKKDKNITVHYLGEISNGKANGGGTGIWSSGSMYRGNWKDNNRHGQGTFEWADGVKYIGTYKDDKRHGEGTYSWPSGERYEGDWKNDVREGYGILYDQDGNVRYKGSWRNDKPAS